MWRRVYLPAAAAFYTAGNLIQGLIPCDTEHIQETCAMTAIYCTTAFTATFLLYLKFRVPWCIMISFFAIGAGGAACNSFFSSALSTCNVLHEGTGVTVTGIIKESGLSSSGRPFLEIALTNGNANTIIYNIPDSMSFMPGDTVYANVRCTGVRNFTEDFDYKAYMAKRNIYHTCFYSKGSTVTVRHNPDPDIKYIPPRLRHKFSKFIDRVLEGEQMKETRAVVKALSYGYQDEIDSETGQSFRDSGAIHLLALSGMHLGMLYWAIQWILSVIGNSPAAKKVRSAVTIVLIWTYTVFTGCGVSIVRAAVMLSIYETGSFAGKGRNGISSLALSAIIITTFDPDAPSGISFQLSYAAMSAIFIIYPHVASAVRTENRILRSAFGVCAMTVSCQITTAPVIYLHFGTFAFYSLIANLLCSPVVSLTMILIPATLAASNMGTWVPAFMSSVLHWTIKIFILINTTISNL